MQTAIPKDPATAQTTVDGKPADPYQTKSPKKLVLIVDDDPDFLAIAEAHLDKQGFTVRHASGGLRGVFLATHEVPDAILCDLRMPGIDGFVVADALRADPATRHTAIFACTGRRELEPRAAQPRSPFDGVLIKPLDWDEVARRLANAIDARQNEGLDRNPKSEHG